MRSRGAERAVRATRAANGYALVGVLWICAAATALGIAASIASRHAVAASRNRIALARAEWLADACLARVRSALSAALAAERGSALDVQEPVWMRVDKVLARDAIIAAAACTIAARAVGSGLDVNAADETELSHVFRYAGLVAVRADSVAAAIVDWKDADDIPRPGGAEREWYEIRGRVPPSNRAFTHIGELSLVQGVDGRLPFDSLLAVERGPVSINHALGPVLAQLPGFTAEAVASVLAARAAGRYVSGFTELKEALSPGGREALAQGESRLVAAATLTPSAWIVTARAAAGSPPATVAVEVRVERFGPRILTVRRRSWLE